MRFKIISETFISGKIAQVGDIIEIPSRDSLYYTLKNSGRIGEDPEPESESAPAVASEVKKKAKK